MYDSDAEWPENHINESVCRTLKPVYDLKHCSRKMIGRIYADLHRAIIRNYAHRSSYTNGHWKDIWQILFSVYSANEGFWVRLM